MRTGAAVIVIAVSAIGCATDPGPCTGSTCLDAGGRDASHADGDAGPSTNDATSPDTGIAPGALGAPCARNGDCLSSLCLASGHCSEPCTTSADCVAGWTCAPLPGVGNLCQCTVAVEDCNGRDDDCDSLVDDGVEMCASGCSDLGNDPANCGACGHACAVGGACASSACVCPGVQGAECGGTCVDLDSDAANCGACGHACTWACTGAACGPAEVAAGFTHTCARNASGTVACWGRNGAGELGDSSMRDQSTPVMLAGVTDARALALGGGFTCVLRATGNVVCLGDGSRGALGDGATTHTACASGLDCSLTPVAVMGLSDATQIAAGTFHACAVRAGGTVVCWGLNEAGELGDGITTHDSCGSSSDCTRVPVTVVGLTDAVEVVAGHAYTCARHASGAVSCWGANANGQLGDGTTTSHGMPAPVTGLADAVELGASWGFLFPAGHLTAIGSHTCARRASGTVTCWGSDMFGELGDGSMTASPVPTAVPGVTGAVEIAVGAAHNCARLADGTVACWGDGTDGQLGDGTRMNRASPVDVLGLPDAASITAGAQHTCARTSRGVVCWGYDADGELGDGASVSSPMPVVVSAP